MAADYGGGHDATKLVDDKDKNHRDVNAMPFDFLCQKLDKLMKKKKKEKDAVLCDIWMKLGNRTNLYPLMRLLLPQLDTERPTYGLRESTIGDMYVRAMGIAKTSEAAQRLKNYKNPRSAGAKAEAAAGDFTTILYDVLRNRAGVREGAGRATIADVNQILDELATKSNKDDKKKVYMQVLTTLSAREQFWLARVILKDMKMGVRHESMLKLYHPKATDIYNASSSLARVCELVADPDRMKKEMSGIQLFQPMKPMLCNNPNWRKVIGLMKGAKFVIQDKFDGERILIHKKGDEVKFFTRNSIDYTLRYNYGSKFTPTVMRCVKVENCILDGEIVTWNRETKTYEPFGTNRTVALAGEDDGKQLCYKAFDILLVDDKALIDLPLSQRREILEKSIANDPHSFEVIDQITTVTETMGLMDALDNALLGGLEGIIVKRQDSSYLLNDRSNAWIKLKPDYVDGLGDNLDLLIIGGYYGEGTRRAGDISHFLLGVAEKNKTPGEPPVNFYSFCKVGSGYSLDELANLRGRLKDKWIKYHPSKQPKHFMGWKHEKCDIPDVWIRPEHSVIVELKCYEITPCRKAKFHAEYTTRFPRAQAIRWDKNWDDCMTIDDIRALVTSAGERMKGGARRVAEEGGYGGMARPAWGGGYHNDGEEVDEKARSAAAGEAGWDDGGGGWAGLETKTEHVNIPSSSHAAAGETMPPDTGTWGGYHEPAGGAAGAGPTLDGIEAPTTSGAYGPIDELDDWVGGKKKTKKKGIGRRQHLGVMDQFRATDVTGVAIKQPLFHGMEFCVISDDAPTCTKSKIETLVTEWGGTFVQNARQGETTMMIAGKETFKVKSTAQKDIFDIIRYNWLLDSIAERRRLPFLKKYVIHATAPTQVTIAKEVDPYGDQFIVPATRSSLLDTFVEVRKQHVHPFVTANIDERMDYNDSIGEHKRGAGSQPTIITGGGNKKIEKDERQKRQQEWRESEDRRLLSIGAPPGYQSQFFEFDDDIQEILASPYTMFRRYVIYVDRFSKPGDVASAVEYSRLEMTASVVRLFGGEICDLVAANITHVVFNDDELGPEGGLIRLDEIKRTLQEYRLADPSVLEKKFVTAAWVTECVRAGKLLPERDFLPKARGAPPPRPLSPVHLPNIATLAAGVGGGTSGEHKSSRSSAINNKRSRDMGSPTSGPTDPNNIFVPSTLGSVSSTTSHHGRTSSTTSTVASRTSVASGPPTHGSARTSSTSSVSTVNSAMETKRRRAEN